MHEFHNADIVPYWPYTPRYFLLRPDFTNQVNAAEKYRQPVHAADVHEIFNLAADEMEQSSLPAAQPWTRRPQNPKVLTRKSFSPNSWNE